MLLDSHCHVTYGTTEEIEHVISHAFERGIWMINIGTYRTSSERGIEIANRYNAGLWTTVGCHPNHLHKDITEKATFGSEEFVEFVPREAVDFLTYESLALSSPKVVGIGETGLDYFRLDIGKENEIITLQENIFRGFIRLAKNLCLPLVLHCRGSETDRFGAYDDMYRILKEEKASRGVVHCYGGNALQAKKFIELGFYISFAGVITFKNAKNLHEVVRAIPLDRLLIETDAPFLAPEPHRGKKNQPAFVELVAQQVASIKGLSFDEVARATYENTNALFKFAER